jgi:hypothetical protein
MKMKAEKTATHVETSILLKNVFYMYYKNPRENYRSVFRLHLDE